MTTQPAAVVAAVVAAVADAHHHQWAFVLAATVRVTRDLDLAEECVQDAYAKALTAWAERGIPGNPGGWPATAAHRQAIDRHRRQATARRVLPLLVADSRVDAVEPGPDERVRPAAESGVVDDRLRLIFTCCHPALATEAQVALTLRLLCGLTTAEVARAFLVSESTMAARITRAKKKIATARIPYRVPPAAELRERNALLHAAGLPAAYPKIDVHGADQAPFRAAIDTLLAAHLPYPALVLDVHWNVLLANTACARLYGGDLVGTNVVRRFLADPVIPESIVNWADVAWASLLRLRHQLDQAPFDDRLRELVTLAETATSGLPRPDPPTAEPVVCPWFRVGDQVIRTIGMVARFDGTAEITLDELRIELTYPLDQTADRFFRDGAG